MFIPYASNFDHTTRLFRKNLAPGSFHGRYKKIFQSSLFIVHRVFSFFRIEKISHHCCTTM